MAEADETGAMGSEDEDDLSREENDGNEYGLYGGPAIASTDRATGRPKRNPTKLSDKDLRALKGRLGMMSTDKVKKRLREADDDPERWSSASPGSFCPSVPIVQFLPVSHSLVAQRSASR